jgi:predicted enzyme related to lactoylglutathione lyase
VAVDDFSRAGRSEEQDRRQEDPVTRISSVRTVAVPVADQERALTFYRDVLGLGVRLDASGGGMRWLEVAPEGAATSVALALAGEGTATGVDTGIRFSTADAAADHAALTAAGAAVETEVLRFPGVPPMFSLRDPDGNRLYVVESA